MISAGPGVAPDPDFMMRYCNTLGRSMTPGFAAFVARYSRLACGLMSPAKDWVVRAMPNTAMIAAVRMRMTRSLFSDSAWVAENHAKANPAPAVTGTGLCGVISRTIR